MARSRRIITVAALGLAVALLSHPAAGAVRAPIRDCGDIATLDRGSAFGLGAVTAQNTTCKNARAIARGVARSTGCTSRGFCRQRTYTCLLARAGKELVFVRCEGKHQTAFVRFELGS